MEDDTKKNSVKQVDLRSEEVQEVMGSIPAWIVRWGITLLFIVTMAILIGSYFFRYPDVITSEMTLTGRYPAVQVVSRSSGKINQLMVADGVNVTEGTVLAVIENPASTADILFLKENLKLYPDNPDSLSAYFPKDRDMALGDVQTTYVSFLRSLQEYRNYIELNYYPQKIAATHNQIDKYKQYAQNLKRQLQVVESRYDIAHQQYERDSLLFSRNVISPYEQETARSALLQSRQTVEDVAASFENAAIQIASLETAVLDLQLQEMEKKTQLQQDLQTTASELANVIHTWELTYCLTSPIDGKVTFTKYWNENQYIPLGDPVFTVVPATSDLLMGKALLPVARSGKVKVGQRVIVRFSNYPDQEFGVVNGTVNSISLVPTDNNYTIEIAFPQGLITNYGKTLPVSHEMTATAEIVTDDLRLIERFFMPLKKVFREGLGL
ncbi:HlyD family secretion protein [Parabacteroides provencensis]|uniref:HlyD family secretion protein n=1 Tax=Parabacteroides provencensis TaxID=1944636 RepID=UPI000C1624F9|nr:HlyD family efflux transporter periplasmic adaptor subunit [Parabacteroides provencensis]